MQWSDDLVDAQQFGHVDGVHRPGPAVGDQGKLAGVVAPLHADVADGADHGVVCDAQDAAGGGVQLHVQWAGDLFPDGLGGGVCVQGQSPADDLGVDAAKHQVGVRDCRCSAAFCVANRAWDRSGAGRSNRQTAVGRDVGDTAPAAADGGDVQHGELDGPSAQPPRQVCGWAPLPQQRDVGAGAPHIEGYGVSDARVLCDLQRGHHPSGRAG